MAATCRLRTHALNYFDICGIFGLLIHRGGKRYGPWERGK